MTITRADIAYAVNKVAQYCEAPCKAHWTAVRRILQYVKETVEFGIKFGSGPAQLVGYSDSDYAGDTADRKSTGGHIFFLAGGPVSWRSRKAKSVARSTAEAELQALGDATAEAIWLRRLMADLQGHSEESEGPVLINEDNRGAIVLARNGGSVRAKHIDIQLHFIKDEIEKGVVEVKYCPSDDMLADGLTKPLPGPAFEDHRQRISICSIR